MVSAPLHSCIQLNQNLLCFDKIRQYFIYPELPLTLINPKNVPITAIPLYQSFYSSRKAVVSLDSISVPNFCSFFVDFENRSEFVNLLILDQLVPVSTFYILGPQNEFVSHFKAGMLPFQKFGRLSSDSYSKLKIVTNSEAVCADPSIVSLSAVNGWKANPWSFWFAPSDSIRIPLPFSSIFTYHVVTRNVHNRIIRSGYEVLRSQGVIVNKTKELGNESLRVRGIPRKHDSVLSFLKCTPERVELNVSIRIESNLYDVAFAKEAMPFQFARFVFVDESENVFDVECSTDSPQCRWKMPISSPSLELLNPDHAIGELDFSHYFSFWVDSNSQNLVLSSLESNSFQESVSGETVYREYQLVCDGSEGVLDLNLKGESILSVMLNNRILYSSSRSPLEKEFRISTPVFCSPPMRLVVCYHQGELHVAARIIDCMLLLSSLSTIAISFPSSSFHNRTNTIQSEALLAVNSIAFPASAASIPPFDFAVQTQQGHWKRLFTLPTSFETPFPVSTLIQFSNPIPSIRFSISTIAEALEVRNLRAWQGRLDLTPGLFFPVPRGCYVYFSIGETVETGDMEKPEGVVPLSYGLFFDWSHEVLFGIGRSEEFPADNSTDSAVISSHLQLTECSGNFLKVTLDVSPATFSSFWIEDTIHIPTWMGVSSVTVCLESGSLYEVFSGSMMSMEVSTDHWSYTLFLRSSHSTTLSTAVFSPPLDALEFSLPSSLHTPFVWKSGSEAPSVIVKPAFVLRLPIAANRLEAWQGTVVSLLLLDFGSAKSVTIGSISGVVPSAESRVNCTPRCAVRILRDVALESVLVHVTRHSHLTFASFAFSIVTFQKESLVALPRWSEAIAPISFVMIPTCLTRISMRYRVSKPIMLHIFADIRHLSRIIHNVILTPAPSHAVSIFSQTFEDLGTISRVDIRAEPFDRSSRTDVQFSEIELSCVPNITRRSFVQYGEIKEEFHPLWEKLEKLGNLERAKKALSASSGSSGGKPAKKKTAMCPEEFDEANGALWKRSLAVTYVSHRCEDGHLIWRFCTVDGRWKPVEGSCGDAAAALLQKSIQRAAAPNAKRESQPEKEEEDEKEEKEEAKNAQDSPKATTKSSSSLKPDHSLSSKPEQFSSSSKPDQSSSSKPEQISSQTDQSSSSSKPEQPSSKPDHSSSKPDRSSSKPDHSSSFCPPERSADASFPSTPAGSFAEVPCQSPAFGRTRRLCSASGRWEAATPCRRCPRFSFPFFNATSQTTECLQVPSGSAFLRGNPRSAVKCYGQYYSEGGATACSLCAGETRGSREHGNIACRPCANGVLVGMACVNASWCLSAGQRTRVGALVKRPCDSPLRGVVTQMCRYNSGPLGVLGPRNSEGCCRPGNTVLLCR